MTFDERLAAVCDGMSEQGLAALVAVHDGDHFIETPNPVLLLSRFMSLGPSAVVLRPDGETVLVATPSWNAGRAADCRPDISIVAADDVAEGLARALGNAVGGRSRSRGSDLRPLGRGSSRGRPHAAGEQRG